MSPHSISVVIPTLNRASVIFKTVNELLSGKSENLNELIVVDQSDEPLDLDRACTDSRLVYQYTPIKNLPRARNIGANLATGDVVLYLDDDVTGVGEIAERHLIAHRASEAVVVTGPIIEPAGAVTPGTNWDPPGWRYLSPPGFAPGCNASYRRDVILRVGGFDENFTGGAIGEDAEMTHRIRENGGAVVFDNSCRLIHLNVRTGGCRNETDDITRLSVTINNCHYFWHKVGAGSSADMRVLNLIRANAIVRRSETGALKFFRPDRFPRLLWAWLLARRRTKALLAADAKRLDLTA